MNLPIMESWPTWIKVVAMIADRMPYLLGILEVLFVVGVAWMLLSLMSVEGVDK